jgi:hypothetical protein
MIPRRNFLSLLSTGIATGWMVLSRNQSVSAAVAPTAHGTDSCQAPGQEKFADPPWKKLSSASGDLPVPQTSDQQTGCVVGDIDGDGRPDFAITNRHQGKAAIWMENTAQGWKQHIIDPGPLNIEAGSDLFDVDGDGHLDLVAGGDFSSNEVWWWENPYPDYERPWVRHTIKASGATQHHDLMVGDILGEGRAQVVFWNQGANALYLARIPNSPRTHKGPWDVQLIHKGDAPMEGLAMADIDEDGVLEVIGGGRWFKHQGRMQFSAHVIDEDQKFSRCAAGKLIRGSKGVQVVFCNGDGCGPLKWYEQRNDGTWAAHDLLGEDLVHGHSLRVADIDGDGNLDILCAEMGKWADWTRTVDNPRTHIWVFYGDGKGNFEKVTIAKGGYGTHEARLADFFGSGRLDILSKPYESGAPGVDIWINPGRKERG